jgi:voltage-gated potassium channel
VQFCLFSSKRIEAKVIDLKKIVERNDSGWGRVFDLCIQALIVLSLIAFAVETLPDLSGGTKRVLHLFEVVCVSIFTLEYGLRWFVATPRWKFITSFFGIIDLIAILPFYLSLGIDIRSIRAFRLLRLFRAFKLARYSAAIQRFHRAFLIAK